MSRQHGVSASLASIEAAPPIHGTQTTSTISHSHSSTSPCSSSTPPTSNSSQSENISSRVHIPKLSAATTELLARLAGNIKGTQQQELRDDARSMSRSPFPLNTSSNCQSTSSQRAGKMRVSSTLIELPTAPFVYPARVEGSVVTPSRDLAPPLAPHSVNEDSVKINSLNSIAPSPATYSTSAPAPGGPQISARTEPPPDHPPSSIGINGASANHVNIASKPAAPYSTSAPLPARLQEPVIGQPTPVHHPSSTHGSRETPSSYGLINIAPRSTATMAPISTGPNEPVSAHLSPNHSSSSNNTSGNSTRPHHSINIAPKPTVTTSTSVLEPVRELLNDVQVPSGQSLPPPIVPLSRAPTILKYSSKSLPTFSAAISSKAPSNIHQRRSVGGRKIGSKKRKRGHDSDGEDIIRAVDSSSDESDVTPTATQTTSGRQVKRPSLYVPSPLSPALPKDGSNLAGAVERPQDTTKPRKRVPRKVKNTNVTCTYCQRGHSLSTNTIVFCDGCNRAWHQYCHDPPIENEVITVKEKEWFCKECKPVQVTVLHPTVVRSNPSLTTKPPVHPPLTIPQAEIGAEHFPIEYRRAFLSTLSHAALVELLLTVSENNPAVPMFPRNIAALPQTKFAPTQAILASNAAIPTPPGLLSIDPIFSNSIHPSISREGRNGQPTPNLGPESARNNRQDESSDDDSEYEFQDHRLYPRAGNGVRLSNNQEDLDILQEDPACATFSYALHASASGIAGDVSA
ncbi:hypothetical protein BDV18DRAFT_129500 [Aspergillus unguis]